MSEAQEALDRLKVSKFSRTQRDMMTLIEQLYQNQIALQDSQIANKKEEDVMWGHLRELGERVYTLTIRTDTLETRMNRFNSDFANMKKNLFDAIDRMRKEMRGVDHDLH